MATQLGASMGLKHIAQLIQVGQGITEGRLVQAQEYLTKYFSGAFNIKVYWGTPQQFLAELKRRWDDYSKYGT
jgi:hypothetical protein